MKVLNLILHWSQLKGPVFPKDKQPLEATLSVTSRRFCKMLNSEEAKQESRRTEGLGPRVLRRDSPGHKSVSCSAQGQLLGTSAPELGAQQQPAGVQGTPSLTKRTHPEAGKTHSGRKEAAPWQWGRGLYSQSRGSVRLFKSMGYLNTEGPVTTILRGCWGWAWGLQLLLERRVRRDGRQLSVTCCVPSPPLLFSPLSSSDASS